MQWAFLFGTWVTGRASEVGDIDVAHVSDAFTGDRFLDRRGIVPLRRKINTRIEPIPFHQQSFEQAVILSMKSSAMRKLFLVDRVFMTH